MRTKAEIAKIEKLELELVRVCREHYEACVGSTRHLTPKHPYILVRVLPKEHITGGGIILPETEQNKPVYEAIVIETWKPWDETREVKKRFESEIRGEYQLSDHTEFVTIHHECTVKPGDRIAFQHFSGIAMYGYLDDKCYRLIAEDERQGPNTNILGTIDYDGDYDVAAQLRELTAKMGSVTTSGVAASRRMIDM